MTKLKEIKKLLKQSHKYRAYKKKFQHKDMKLLFSNVALTFNAKIETDILIQEELKLADEVNGPKMFLHSFKKLSKYTNKKIDWESFGHFVWYIYQTSTYWKNKSGSNIFTKENYVEQNEIKRHYFYNWLESIPPQTASYNLKIKEVMKRVF
ncbi:hypothetical protein [Candidatus Mycoplasma mahonii]|uniref:hypothetical protein n=1 Tax=Candidatus Mycoplasma mahonii TaxID=3004105 RepID=UPI0026F02745|nr:hypothetical protein [Candidatus Mycoplasma mahonii]WKX02208.1 hypothetical protein O3I44_02275 [Candidatus Mycoplasma mahonii]